MAGFVRMNPAHVAIPASAALLAGMAWRVGWIDGSVLGMVLFAVLAPLAVMFTVLLLSLPLLLAVALIWYLVRGIARLRRLGPVAGMSGAHVRTPGGYSSHPEPDVP